MKRNTDLKLNPAVADAAVIIGSDLSVDGKRFIYLRDHGKFDDASAEFVKLGETGIAALLESCGLTLLRVRPLCVDDEYAVTAQDEVTA